MYELYTQRETAQVKFRKGMFPWSKRTVERMWQRGEFPVPMKIMNRNLWDRGQIEEYDRLLKTGLVPREAAERVMK